MILMIIIGIILIIIILRFNIKDDKKRKIEEKTDKFSSLGFNYIDILNASYKGGIKNISANSPVSTNLLKEGIGFQNDTMTKIILFKNIQDISLQNKQYIKNQVSLGKLIVFGVFAFGMDGNKQSVNDEYIILSINDEDGEYNILLQAIDIKYNQELYNKLLKYVNNK